VQTKNFIYLGSTISDDARLDGELIFRTGKTIAVYGKLRERIVGQPPCVPSSKIPSIQGDSFIYLAVWGRNMESL